MKLALLHLRRRVATSKHIFRKMKIDAVFEVKSVWARVKHVLRVAAIKAWLIVTKPFRPVLVAEGAKPSRWYGYCRFIPTNMQTRMNAATYQWETVAYLIPLNVIVSLFLWCKWKVKYGCRLDPQFYQRRCFDIPYKCEHCGEDLCERIFWPKDVRKKIEEMEKTPLEK